MTSVPVGKSRRWQTDRMQFLDSPEMINATVRVLKGGLPGTNKEYDAQKASDDLIRMLFAELGDQSGAHVETALVTLGALAGFSVQMSLREAVVKPGKLREDEVFVTAHTEEGETFYLGDLPNEGLFGGQPGVISIFGLVAGGAQSAGAKEPPDAEEIATYVTGTIGTDKFGVPRVPAEHMPHTPAIDLLNNFWNPIRNYLVISVQVPLHWPMVLALCAQKVIIMTKDALDPALASKLVMETAVAMAKIDPAKVHFAYFQAY
jgi:hypothetical protein